MFQHPGLVSEGVEHRGGDAPAGMVVAAAFDLAGDLVLEAGHAPAPGDGQVAAVTVQDDVQAGEPGDGLEGLLDKT